MRDRAVPFEETVDKEMSEEEKRELSRKSRELDEILEAQEEKWEQKEAERRRRMEAEN